MPHFERYNPNKTGEEYQAYYTEKLEEMFAVYETHGIDVRLVGSLGRAAALGESVTNFQDEYGATRDIDIMIVNSPPHAGDITKIARQGVYPLSIDEHFSSQISISLDSATIRYKDLEVPIDPKVFAAKKGNLNGLSVLTFDPNTLFHMSMLGGPLRPKDYHNLKNYAQKLEKRNDIVDEASFLPFHHLDQQRRHYYRGEQGMAQLRWDYHTYVPMPVRKALVGITIPVWNALKGDN